MFHIQLLHGAPQCDAPNFWLWKWETDLFMPVEWCSESPLLF